MRADIYTKAFSDKAKWLAVCVLINVVDPKQFSQLAKAKFDQQQEQEHTPPYTQEQV